MRKESAEKLLIFTIAMSVCMAAIFFSGFCRSFAADMAVKIGVIDLQKALNRCLAGKEAYTVLKRFKDEKDRILSEKDREIRALQQELEKQGIMLSEEARTKKMRELQMKQKEFQRKIKDFTEEMRQKERDVLSPILRDMENIAKEIGRKEGYTFIINKELLIYYPETIDITDKLIEEYDKRYREEKEKK